MPTVYMMIGVPASGKSTYAKNLNLPIVSPDDFIEKYAAENGNTYNDVFESYVGTANKLFDQQIANHFANDESFVWDQTNISIKSRANRLKAIPNHYDVIAVYVETPEYHEHVRRLNSRVGKTIPNHIMRSMVNNLQAPVASEMFTEVIYVNY